MHFLPTDDMGLSASSFLLVTVSKFKQKWINLISSFRFNNLKNAPVHFFMHIYLCTVYTHPSTPTYIHYNVLVYTYTYAYTYTYINIHIRRYIIVPVWVYTYIYIYILYIHTHARTHNTKKCTGAWWTYGDICQDSTYTNFLWKFIVIRVTWHVLFPTI